MTSFRDSSISSANNDEELSVPLSQYAKKLEGKVKQRYMEKIAKIGIDPVLMEGKRVEPDCLPPVESTDLLCYLVLETSFYTQKQFKAFRSLGAYNQMVSGFISDVKGHKIADKFVVLAKVRHSQRMNDTLISLWIITENDGTINCAHCLGCKAGLAESCSHVASVLFYLEAWTKVNGKLSCTQMKCSWIIPTFANDVEYARVSDINFKSAKKMKAYLDESIDRLPELSETKTNSREKPDCNVEVPAPSEPEMAKLYQELSECQSKPVILSLVSPYAESYVLSSRKIPTVMDLFDVKYLKLPYNELVKVCQDIKIEITKEQIDRVQQDTLKQAKGNNFFKHRAGRIGASQNKAAASTDPSLPAQSLIQGICYPELNKLTKEAVVHGCKHEAGAIHAYEQLMKTKHVNYKVLSCGTFINEDYPWLHATPDFLCSCDCCGEGCGEVKCPLCIENFDFDTYVKQPSSCLKKNKNNQFELIKKHQYYYQVQQQLFTTKLKYCDFVVCAVGHNNEMALVGQRITPDIEHWNEVLPKLETFWRVGVLPEVLGRWYTRRRNVHNLAQKNAVCYCRQMTEEEVVHCSNPDCVIRQFHLSCLGVSGIPKTWYCPNCRTLPQFKRGGKKQSLNNEALKLKCICICKATPNSQDKLVKCANESCSNGRFFHLTCLGRKRMPNNSNSWLCPVCSVSNANARSSVNPNSSASVNTNATGSVNPNSSASVNPNARASVNPNSSASVNPNATASVNPNSSASVNPNARASVNPNSRASVNPNATSNVTCTGSYSPSGVQYVKTVHHVNKQPRDKHAPVGKLGNYEYGLIASPSGWLDCVIIHEAHILLRKISNGIEGFQRPTLGPVRQFDIMSGPFIQIVHINNNHWVCMTSIGSFPGYVNLLNSLSSPITQEILDLAENLTGPMFRGVTQVPVQQQQNGSDCGVFSIAYATSLVHGQNPEHVNYDIPKMRLHLLHCLKSGQMSPFPTT